MWEKSLTKLLIKGNVSFFDLCALTKLFIARDAIESLGIDGPIRSDLQETPDLANTKRRNVKALIICMIPLAVIS